jgi:hydroxyacylglutathione hydrolase
MLRYHTIPVTPFQQNASLVWCDETKQAAVIDPGGDLDLLIAEAARLGVTLTQIWLTHAHIDHAGGTADAGARGCRCPSWGRTRVTSSGSTGCRSRR